MADGNILVDRLYEAAMIPELWSSVCASLCLEVDAFSAAIFTESPQKDIGFVCNDDIRPLFEHFSQHPARFQNLRPGRALERYPGTFVRVESLMSKEELENDPIHQDMVLASGLEDQAGAVIQDSSGHLIVFDLMKRKENGIFLDRDLVRLNQLKPDLARAALISSRLAFSVAQSIASALSLIGLPAAVIADGGAVLAANDPFAALTPQIRIGAGDRLSLSTEGAQALLDDCYQRLRIGFAPSVQSIPLPGREDLPARILHIVPVKRQARDIFSRSLFIVMVTTVGEVGPPDLRVLSGLFDLTPSEARVAREIANGTSYDMVAARLSLSLETVRGYAKQIKAKTGTTRQAELTALLSGLGRIDIRP